MEDEGDALIKGKPLWLKNGMGFLRMRRKAAIIRYFRPNKEDTEQYDKTTMLLFYLFRNWKKWVTMRDIYLNQILTLWKNLTILERKVVA